MTPEDNYTSPMEGYYIIIQRRKGSQKPKFLKETMKVNWAFWSGGWFKPKNLFVGGYECLRTTL